VDVLERQGHKAHRDEWVYGVQQVPQVRKDIQVMQERKVLLERQEHKDSQELRAHRVFKVLQ
jgi:hypothetical protein